MPRRKLPPNEEIVSLYRSGLSTGEIGRRFGASPISVVGLLRRIGEPRRSNSEAQQLTFARGRKANSFWKGKKQSKEFVERRVSKIRGENHYMWKGGHARRPYRKLIQKKKCARCNSSDNLAIHHQDDNHYNNDVKNLVVLCLGCHMSIHKTAYWKAWREGKSLPKSNGPVGWLRKESGSDGGQDNSRQCD